MKVLVTGASSGIGRAVYAGLKKIGHEVCGVSDKGPDFRLDFYHSDSVSVLAEYLSEIWQNGFSAAILNAGVFFLDEGLPDSDQCAEIYRINYEFNHEFLDAVESGGINLRKSGSIILVSSVFASVGDSGSPFYSSMKAALVCLAKCFAKRLSDRLIRVNCVSPGYVDTNLVSEGEGSPDLSRVLLGQRLAKPEELFPVFRALLECPYITGQDIVVDGGFSVS